MRKHRSNASFLGAACLIVTMEGVCLGQYKQPYLLEPEMRMARAKRFEVYALGQYWHTDEATANNITVPTTAGPTATGDLQFKMDDAALFGFGVAYNINNHLAVNGEFTFGYPDYTLTFLGSTLSGEAFLQGGKFNVEYNILPGAFTPFISAGLGYLYIDSQVPSGPTSIYCFWDYWWGNVCTGDTPTYHNAYLALNAAVGVRWDIQENFFIKINCGGNWANVHNTADWVQSLQATAALGWKF